MERWPVQKFSRNGMAFMAMAVFLGSVLTPVAFAQKLAPARLMTASGVVSPITLNILIGKHLGYYEKEGLQFELASLGATGQGPIIQGVSAGKFEFGTVDATSLLSLDVQGEDLPLKAFYVYTQEHPEVVAVPEGSPIKSFRELKGKKIGVRDITRARYPKGMLLSAGIDPESAEYIPVGIGSGPVIALKRGDVHALSLFDIDIARVESLGMKLTHLPLSDEWRLIQGPLLITYEKFIKDHPDRIIGFGRAVAKSTLFTITNPEAAVRVFYTMYPEALPKGQTREEAIKDVLYILKARLPKLMIENRKVTKWGYIEPESWRVSSELLGYKGKVRKPYTAFYTNQFIDAMNQFDQAAIVKQAKSYKIE